jgi:acyl-CoA thioester hydrolase
MTEAPGNGEIRDHVHRLALRVYYAETDAAGIVYHANYLTFMERGRTEMLRCTGFSQPALKAGGADGALAFAVRRCVVDYLRPARLDDVLVVETRITAIGAAWLDFTQIIRRGDETLVVGDLKVACIEPGGRPRRLPPAMRATFTAMILPASKDVQARKSNHGK